MNPSDRTRLGIELLTAYLDRAPGPDSDAADYIANRLTESIVDPTMPSHGEYTAGLLYLAELLVLHLAKQLAPDTGDLRAMARGVLQHMAVRLPE